MILYVSIFNCYLELFCFHPSTLYPDEGVLHFGDISDKKTFPLFPRHLNLFVHSVTAYIRHVDKKDEDFIVIAKSIVAFVLFNLVGQGFLKFKVKHLLNI